MYLALHTQQDPTQECVVTKPIFFHMILLALTDYPTQTAPNHPSSQPHVAVAAHKYLVAVDIWLWCNVQSDPNLQAVVLVGLAPHTADVRRIVT